MRVRDGDTRAACVMDTFSRAGEGSQTEWPGRRPLKQAILNVHIQAQVQITFTSGSLNYVLYKVAGELLDLKARSTSLSLGGLISTEHYVSAQ